MEEFSELKSARLLSIYARLLNGRVLKKALLAQEFGVTARSIQRDLEWLGLSWDRIERQSDRLERYAQAADELRGSGRLYEVFETPTELDLKRKKQLNMGKPPVYDRAGLNLSADQIAAYRAEGRDGYWRFLLDQERIEWPDGILGDISIDAASVSDPVLIRADGQVLYTFASSVDDTDMAVTHIVRGADHVTNTATQIQIIRALGAKVKEGLEVRGVPTSRATRVTSLAKELSWSTMVLMVFFSSRISPFTSTVILRLKSPRAMAVATLAMLRTCPVRFEAM